MIFFFFQAEDGIRDLVRSRGLGDVYKRQAPNTELLAAPDTELAFVSTDSLQADKHNQPEKNKGWLLLATCAGTLAMVCLLYTSDAADEEDSVDLGGRRIIKKKK
eukprot:TRINITY_DN1602_c0_g1_i8.p1 TRINITY_DN1602_c0_g1~~TRINITY_DN1602_c0_g1_i8.p1  ORF type:complete len:105 (+),score=30.44 TRINITY_DN1602_c0_g1_i8:22-336(+)